MKARKWIALLTFLTAVLLIGWGCSGGGEVGVTIPQVAPPSAQSNGGTGLWGIWQVAINPQTEDVEITQLRQCDYILNVLGFLEPPALKGMTIDFSTLSIDLTGQKVNVDVILTHPLKTTDNVFHGFDVRGIVFGPKTLNADGLTVVMNPDDFAGVPFGYIDGLLGAPNSFAHYDGLWGYRYFCDGLALNDDLALFFSDPANLNNRGVFKEGSVNRRHYTLAWAGSGYGMLVFNYAVYANYNWPVGTPPYDLSDFEITAANSQEAFCAKFTEVSNSLYFSGTGGGGTLSLDAEIWDWQGLASAEVSIEASGGGVSPTPPTSSEPGGTAYSTLYHWVDIAANPTTVGQLDFIVTVTDTMTFGGSWFLNLLPTTNPLYNEKIYNCFLFSAVVTACPPPVITQLDPDYGSPGALLDDVKITGTFISGTLLGVKLKKTGETDIIGSDVKFVNSTTITTDLNLTGAAGGKWDVVVTNGCGTEGTLTEGFIVVLPPPTAVGDISLSTGRVNASPCEIVDDVTITWTAPGDPNIKEYGIYVDTSPYTGLNDNFQLLGVSTSAQYIHNASSLVPLNGNAAYSYTVRTRSIATGGAAIPGSESGDSQYAFIELDNFTGGTAAGGGTWTSQSDDGTTLWKDISTGSYLINGAAFGRNTPWNIAGGSEAAAEWTMLTSPKIPDVPNAKRAIMELNHDQRGSYFSSWASRAVGTYSTVPPNGTNQHTLGDFDWVNQNGAGQLYNRNQGWDLNPIAGPSWALIFLEPEAIMNNIGYYNQWAFTWVVANAGFDGPRYSSYSWWTSTCFGDASGYAGGRRYVGIGFGRYWECTVNNMDAIVHDDIAVIID